MESGASLSKVMTGTPRATASLMAPVTLPASEQERRTALAPSFTACAMRWAWICPSSWGGVSQAISMASLCSRESSRAAASAPVRAERKTGLVELLAIMRDLEAARAARGGGAGFASGLAPGDRDGEDQRGGGRSSS